MPGRVASPDPAAMRQGMPPDLSAALRACLATFRRDLEAYGAAVAAAVKVPVSAPEFDALVSFHYNTGASPTLVEGNREGESSSVIATAKPKARQHPPHPRERRRIERNRRQKFEAGTRFAYEMGFCPKAGCRFWVRWSRLQNVLDEGMPCLSAP